MHARTYTFISAKLNINDFFDLYNTTDLETLVIFII